MIKIRILIYAVAAISLTGCGANSASGAWPASTPEAQGIDGGRIAAAVESIKAGDTGIHSLLVVRHGYLVSETYFGAFDKDTLGDVYSVTKSVVSTLCGIAIDQGKLAGVDLPVTEILDFRAAANPDPRKRAITIESLLTMRSGLDWTEGNPAYRAFSSSPDQVAFVSGGRMRDAPGGAFNYDSGAVHLLSAALGEKVGMPVADYAKRMLFDPLGIRRFEWEKDRQGVSIGGWGLRMTPRDMAKLGYLMLRNGQWEGKRIVSKAWVESATRTQVPNTGSADGLGYGYLWWVYPAVEGFAALGLDGQTILVVPKKDLVVVVTAKTPDHGHKAIFSLLTNYIVPAAR